LSSELTEADGVLGGVIDAVVSGHAHQEHGLHVTFRQDTMKIGRSDFAVVVERRV
jgi:hypothetical protein